MRDVLQNEKELYVLMTAILNSELQNSAKGVIASSLTECCFIHAQKENGR